MGDLVDRKDLPAAVSLNSVGFNLMRSVGPAAGGLIVATLGASLPLRSCHQLSAAAGAMSQWKPKLAPRVTTP